MKRGNVKSQHLPQVRVSKTMMRQIEDRAIQEDMNISEYIRYVIRKDIENKIAH